MKKMAKACLVIPSIILLLSGCAYAPAWVTTGQRVSQRAELESYSVAKNKIPLPPAGYIRIYIYRPQTFIGAFGKAIIIVDGKWMGDPARAFETNLLLPGAVFIVDSPSEIAKVWWYQEGKTEEDKALLLPSTQGSTWYLRWGIKPTYGYLENVPEQKAMSEIATLRFSGYVKLERPETSK